MQPRNADAQGHSPSLPGRRPKSLRGRRLWPEQDEQKAPSEAMVEAACPACDAVHAIHDDLGGYKLQCDCGAWLRVPRADIAMQRPVAAAGDRLVMAAKEKALKGATHGRRRAAARGAKG